MINDWLENHWVAGALFMVVALLLLVPVVAAGNDHSVLLIYLASAVYMIHQVEEHTGDRFRSYVNGKVFGGVEAPTVGDVLWINLPGVWGVNLAALYAAVFAGTGYGLAAPYLILVNGIAHLVMGVKIPFLQSGPRHRLVAVNPIRAGIGCSHSGDAGTACDRSGNLTRHPRGYRHPRQTQGGSSGVSGGLSGCTRRC
jgi:hypothetical protein